MSLTSNMNCMNLCCHSGKGLPCFTDCRQSLHIWTHSSLETFSSWCTIITNRQNEILYTGLFSLRVIFALLQLETDSLSLKFAKTMLCLKRDNWRHWNSPSLKFACLKRGRKGRKYTGSETLPVFIIPVPIQYATGIHVRRRFFSYMKSRIFYRNLMELKYLIKNKGWLSNVNVIYNLYQIMSGLYRFLEPISF